MSIRNLLARFALRRQRPVLGLDIGTDRVRMALVHRVGHGYSVDWLEEISLAELQGFADYDAVLAKIDTLVRSRITKKTNVATVPPWSSARISIEEMPAISGDRFHKAAEWFFARKNAEDMLHPVHHAIAQVPRETLEGTQVLDALMVSMDEVMLKGLEDLCRRLGLRLQWLVPAPLCLAPLLRLAGREQYNVLVMDIGAGLTRMTLLADGHARLVRKLKPCANDVVRRVSEKLQIGWEVAGQTLLAHSGVGPLSESDPEGVAARAEETIEKGLDKLAEQLREEIERSRAYVQARHGQQIEEILLTGGLGGSPHLLRRLRDTIQAKVRIFDPFVGIQTVEDLDEGQRSHYGIALGAAIHALEGDGSANLLRSGTRGGNSTPSPEGSRPSLPLRRLAPLAVVFGLVLGLGAWDVRTVRQGRQLENEVSTLDRRHRELSVEADRLTQRSNVFDLEDRIESLRDIYNSRHLYTPFFSRVVECLPDGLWLDALTVSRVEASKDSGNDDADGMPPLPTLQVQLSGRSREVDAIGQFVLVLEREELLEEIEVLHIREQIDQESGGRRGFTFETQGIPVILRQSQTLERAEEAR